MFFDSTAYIVFLVLVVLVYWKLGFRKQNYLLLAASYFFYGWWDWRCLLLMAGSTLVDFLEARFGELSANVWYQLSGLVFRFAMAFRRGSAPHLGWGLSFHSRASGSCYPRGHCGRAAVSTCGIAGGCIP
jgi:hypothetical protein